MRYYRRRWEETRGDRHDDWGHSTWYFETNHEGSVLRQIEVYDGGRRRRYYGRRPEDQDGALSEAPLASEEWSPWLITREEFDAEWRRSDDAAE